MSSTPNDLAVHRMELVAVHAADEHAFAVDQQRLVAHLDAPETEPLRHRFDHRAVRRNEFRDDAIQLRRFVRPRAMPRISTDARTAAPVWIADDTLEARCE